MRIDVLGGGPAGLYFAILAKTADPRREIRVFERNRSGDTFGFGVVFSDQTLDHLRAADAPSHDAIVESFWHWDDIHTFVRDERIVSTGHGFSGMSRKKLLSILEQRAKELDIALEFESERRVGDLSGSDLVVAADGVNSRARDDLAASFRPDVDLRPNRFVWLGTTFPFEAFTFYFDENEHGLWRVHAYRYEEGASTFIVECREDTWRAAGLANATETDTVKYCERLFEKRLDGHPLITNRSLWRQFPTVKNGCWSAANVVLIGDAAHTAHFSIGSGTKLALEDAIALSTALDREQSAERALASYEAERRPACDSLQRAARVSMEWFENTERYRDLAPLRFTFSMLTRSLRVSHENLRKRDPELVRAMDAAVTTEAATQTGRDVRPGTPPMFTPFRLRDLVLENRIVCSPMCQYSAIEGTIGDWHLVHLGSRAMGGAGLVMTEMTDVSREGRITHGCAGMYTGEHMTAWKRVVDFVHSNSRAKIGMQLAHAGRKGATKLLWEGMDEPLGADDWPLISASPLPWFEGRSQVPREMTRADMEAVTADFVRSAEMASAAGFDLLELHFAHGYLISSFLSPLTNERTDAYGGSLENRLRWPLEVLSTVRAAWPEHKPVSVRVSASDWAPGGTSEADVVQTARQLAEHGCDIVDVSTGQTVSHGKPRHGRLFQTPFSELVRLEAHVPTMTVGAISSYADANGIIAGGRADLCVLARAHLDDPYWTRHAARAQGFDLPWPPQYESVARFTPR